MSLSGSLSGIKNDLQKKISPFMNAKARQNNTSRIHGANPRYIIDIFSLSGPSHWWRNPYLAKREGLFIYISGVRYTYVGFVPDAYLKPLVTSALPPTLQ